jgi:hypothetical protein
MRTSNIAMKRVDEEINAEKGQIGIIVSSPG